MHLLVVVAQCARPGLWRVRPPLRSYAQKAREFHFSRASCADNRRKTTSMTRRPRQRCRRDIPPHSPNALCGPPARGPLPVYAASRDLNTIGRNQGVEHARSSSVTPARAPSFPWVCSGAPPPAPPGPPRCARVDHRRYRPGVCPRRAVPGGESAGNGDRLACRGPFDCCVGPRCFRHRRWT